MKKTLIIAVVVLAVGVGIYCFLPIGQDAGLKYTNCELGDLVGDDVERITYRNFNIDYHTEDFKKSQIEDFAKTCVKDGVETQYQMDCCMRMQMYP